MTVRGDDVTSEKMEAGVLDQANGRVHVQKIQLGAQKPNTNNWLKLLSLLLLTPQYAVLILLMRYVRTRPGPMFVTSSTVLMAEVGKTVTCLLIILVDQGGPVAWCRHLYEFFLCRPWDFAKVCLPSLLFVVQNNLVFVAISNLDAATFQVTYQLKILTTALFSVVLLKKQLSHLQWLALLMLFAGVSIIQVQQAMASSRQQTAQPSHGHGTMILQQEETHQNVIKGFLAVLACSCLSGFANVYFERLLKGGKQSVWMRNVQLGLSGIVFGSLACLANDGRKLRELGFFYGYDRLVWTVVLLQSLGGLLVAAVIKYADNILRGFATSGSILLSCLASFFFFDLQMDPTFLLGTMLVLLAVYLYSSRPPIQPDTEMVVQQDAERGTPGSPAKNAPNRF